MTQWDEDRKIIEGASEGPWCVRAYDTETDRTSWSSEADRNRYVCGGEIRDGRFWIKGGHVATVEWHVDGSERADATFIAAARTRWPAVLDALDAALERIGELEGALKALADEGPNRSWPVWEHACEVLGMPKWNPEEDDATSVGE